MSELFAWNLCNRLAVVWARLGRRRGVLSVREAGNARQEQLLVAVGKACFLSLRSGRQIAGVRRTVDEQRGRADLGLQFDFEFGLALAVGATTQRATLRTLEARCAAGGAATKE